MAVGLPKLCHRREPVEGHVLNPFRHLLYGSGSEISVDIALAAKLLYQFKIFMSSEAVVFQHAAPVRVDHFLSGLLRADSVLPVILIGKAAAGPPKKRDLHFL